MRGEWRSAGGDAAYLGYLSGFMNATGSWRCGGVAVMNAFASNNFGYHSIPNAFLSMIFVLPFV